MEQDSQITVKGTLTLTLTDENGNVKDQRDLKNLVVTVGKSLIASRLIGVTDAVPTHMGVGTNATAPVAANTALGTQLVRVATTPSRTNNVVTFTSTFPAGTGTGAITEAGIFNAASAGTMLCRTTFGVVNKAAADALTIVWNVTIS
jgi:hypothetical protein